MKHTPGPWDVQNKGKLGKRSARHEVIEGINHDGKVNLPTIAIMPDLSDRSYANAALIAAVPELIEALEALIFAIQLPGGCSGKGRGESELMDRARAALEKANGE